MCFNCCNLVLALVIHALNDKLTLSQSPLLEKFELSDSLSKQLSLLRLCFCIGDCPTHKAKIATWKHYPDDYTAWLMFELNYSLVQKASIKRILLYCFIVFKCSKYVSISIEIYKLVVHVEYETKTTDKTKLVYVVYNIVTVSYILLLFLPINFHRPQYHRQ